MRCFYDVFYQGGAFFRVFLLRCLFQIYCPCFNYIMRSIILLSINSESCENVSFCFCTDQKDVPQKNVYEVDQELGGRELSVLACSGVGNSPPRKNRTMHKGLIT